MSELTNNDEPIEVEVLFEYLVNTGNFENAKIGIRLKKNSYGGPKAAFELYDKMYESAGDIVMEKVRLLLEDQK